VSEPSHNRSELKIFTNKLKKIEVVGTVQCYDVVLQFTTFFGEKYPILPKCGPVPCQYQSYPKEPLSREQGPFPQESVYG